MASLVTHFFEDIWNLRREGAIDEYVHPTFTFRGSIGTQLQGRVAFKEYVEQFVTAFPDWSIEILEVVESAHKAAARVMYHGTHSAEFLNIPASGNTIQYEGAVFFDFEGGHIKRAWVLGDRFSLIEQLISNREP